MRRGDGDGAGDGIGRNDGGDAEVEVVGQRIGETGIRAVKEDARRPGKVRARERYRSGGCPTRWQKLRTGEARRRRAIPGHFKTACLLWVREISAGNRHRVAQNRQRRKTDATTALSPIIIVRGDYNKLIDAFAQINSEQ